MDEGRLKIVRKSQKQHRKFAYAINDTIRNRQTYYQNCLTKEEQEAQKVILSKVVNMRKAAVRSRVLLQCLKFQKQIYPSRVNSQPVLGRYGGRPISSFNRDVDRRLEWYHPRLRRLRKVDRIKESSLRHGDILDETIVKERIEEFFARDPLLPCISPSETCNPVLTNKTTKNIIDDNDFDLRNYKDPFSNIQKTFKLRPIDRIADLKTKISSDRNVKPLHEKRDAVSRNTSPKRDFSKSVVNDNRTAEYDTKIGNSHKSLNHSKMLPSISSDTASIISGNPGANHDVDAVASSKGGVDLTAHIVKVGRVTTRDDKKDQVQPDTPIDEKPTLTRRKTLVLPPITTSKDMITKKERKIN